MNMITLKLAMAKSGAIKSSVQKVSLVANLIRRLTAGQALLQLEFCRKKVAADIAAVLKSAIANAENNHGLDIDRLIISEIRVGKAFTLKRFKPKSKGRAGKIEKPYSKVTVVVAEAL